MSKPVEMPKTQAPAAMPLDTINMQVTPMQIGNEIRVLVVIADVIGISTQFMLSQPAAKALWHAIREGCNIAETTLVKPQSPILPA